MNKQPTEKTVPSNIEAEEAVLGSILIDPECVPQLDQHITPEDFYLQKHRWIFAAARDLVRSGDPLDFLSLTTTLEQRGQLAACGGAVYISQLINAVPSAVQALYYARLVVEARKRRDMLDMVSEVARVAYNEQMTLSEASAYVQERMNSILAQTTSNQTYQSFAALADRLPPVQWLWPDWIPRGMLSLLGAVPGAGKSLVGLDLARRVICGDTFPDGARNPHGQQTVIYVDAEMVPQLLRDRATAWKVPLERLYLMLPNPNDMIDFGRQEYKDKLRNMVASIQPALVIIDSLSSVTSKGENSVEDIRGIMGFLNEIANNFQTSILTIHHLRKKGGGMQQSLPGFSDLSIDDFRGSSHIIAMSRSVLGLSVVQTTSEPNRNGPRKLEVIKTNLAAYPDPIGCELVQMHPTGVYLRYTNDAPKEYREPSKVDQCAEWLAILLRDGEPLRPKEVVDLAHEEGFSQATVYRARKTLLNIVDTDGHQSPTNKWAWNI